MSYPQSQEFSHLQSGNNTPTGSFGSRRSASNRPRCAQCGTRRFRRDADTGQLICREGHVLQGYREEEVQEDGEFVNTQSQRRYIRKDPSLASKRRRHRRAQEERQVWGAISHRSGESALPFDGKARASFQCYECLQLILRLQLKALRLEWPDLPPEIDAIARDLWTFFVSLNTTLRPTPHTENVDFVTEQLQNARDESEALSDRRSRSKSRARLEQQQIDRMRREDTAMDEDAALQEEQQRKIDERIRQIEGASSRSQEQLDEEQHRARSGTSEEAAESQGQTSSSGNAFTFERMRKATWDPMNVLVCIIYLSLITARVPILWGDLHRLIASNRIPYLSATQLIPQLMIAKLPENELRRLEMTSVPSIVALQERTSRLASDLTERFPCASIRFPELNAAPVLWRLMSDMGLPPTFYNPVRSLLTYVGVPLAVVPDDSVSDPWSLLGGSGEESDGHALPPIEGRLRNNLTPPHATRCSILMAALVVLIKMRYGLDGRMRYNDQNTPSLEVPSLDRWLEALTDHRKALKHSAEFVHELNTHPSHLSEDQIDAMIDFAEEVYFEKAQPNLRYMHRKGDLIGGDLFPTLSEPKMHRSVRPYAEDARPAQEPIHQEQTDASENTRAARPPTLLEIQAKHRQVLHERLYPLRADEQSPIEPRKSSHTTLRPGDAYVVQDTADEQIKVHPAYRSLLIHAATVVGLSSYGGDDDGDGEKAGWREMGLIVSELERLLLRRIRREAIADRPSLSKRASTAASG